MKPTFQVDIEVNESIRLSEIRPADKAAYIKYLSDKSIYDATLRIPHPYTEADAEHFITSVAEATERHGHPVQFAVRSESGELIGGCGFDNLAYGHRAEIGYWLARPFWGRGIMTEAVRAACGFALREWKLARIHAQVFEFNQGSARVLEKNGFELEGLLRKHQKKEDKLIDVKIYGLVRE